MQINAAGARKHVVEAAQVMARVRPEIPAEAELVIKRPKDRMRILLGLRLSSTGIPEIIICR